MSWLPSHTTLRAHPKLAQLMGALGCKRPECVGHLHLLWHWAMDYAPRGKLNKWSHKAISDAAEYYGNPDKFVEALITCGWLDDNMQLHDWREYGGKLIEQRNLGKARMRKFRERQLRVTDANVARNISARARQLPERSRQLRARVEETRVEKRREERGGKPPYPPASEQAPPPEGSHPPPFEDSASPNSPESAASPLALPLGFPKTKEEAIQRAAMRNVPADVAEIEWEKALATGCIDRAGRPILRWENFAVVAAKYHRERTAKEAAKANGHGARRLRGAAAAFPNEQQVKTEMKKLI